MGSYKIFQAITKVIALTLLISSLYLISCTKKNRTSSIAPIALDDVKCCEHNSEAAVLMINTVLL